MKMSQCCNDKFIYGYIVKDGELSSKIFYLIYKL